MTPIKGAIRLVASLRSPVVMVVVVVARLCAGNRANRERNSGDGGQSESKFSHKNHSWACFLSAQ
jgi:hypothetical protein